MYKSTENEPLGWVKFWTPKDDWYYISEEERNRYLNDYKRVTSGAIEQGARLVGVYKCRGQSPWFRFEVWEFPSVNLLISFSNELEDIGHFQYFEESNTIGRKYNRQFDTKSWIV